MRAQEKDNIEAARESMAGVRVFKFIAFSLFFVLAAVSIFCIE